jgi:hypothetical protein
MCIFAAVAWLGLASRYGWKSRESSAMLYYMVCSIVFSILPKWLPDHGGMQLLQCSLQLAGVAVSMKLCRVHVLDAGALSPIQFLGMPL